MQGQGYNLRLRKKKWADKTLNEFKDIAIDEQFDKYKGQWRKIFSNNQESLLPLHLEIGTGKGKFIAEIAERNQGKINFVGLEAKADVLFYAAKKIRAKSLANVKLIQFDAARILDLFSPGEVDRIYINFCDPWPKNRHAKRRLTYKGFLEKYKVILPPGGEIFFKTDNESLFEFSLNEFADFGARIRNISLDLHKNPDNYNENVTTEYEEKFKTLGLKIYRAEFVFQ